MLSIRAFGRGDKIMSYMHQVTGLDKQNIFERKIVNFFLPITSTICFFCAQKNHLIETVLLSTHNICFG